MNQMEQIIQIKRFKLIYMYIVLSLRNFLNYMYTKSCIKSNLILYMYA